MDSELKRLRLIDWDFPLRSSQVLVHDICWYPARFVPAIPAHLIEALSKPGDFIGDPFCGSGTTIAEALLLNRRACGIDVNPYAIRIAETKCHLATCPEILRKPPVTRLLQEIESLMLKVHADAREGPRSMEHRHIRERRFPTASRQPDLFETTSGSLQVRSGPSFPEPPSFSADSCQKQKRAWYHPHTLDQLSTLFALVQEIHDRDVRQVMETVFIATLMPASGHKAKKPYGYFADNVAPKETLYRNAFGLFHARLARLVRRVATAERVAGLPTAGLYQLRCEDAIQPAAWGDIVFDCIITSPPYPGAVDYSTAFRLASHWFPQHGPVESLREAEIGPRWARRRTTSREEYFRKMHLVFENMVTHLHDSGTLAIVLPKGRSQSPTIQRLLRDLESLCNLREVARMERRILKRYFVRKGGGIKTELVIILRKRGKSWR